MERQCCVLEIRNIKIETGINADKTKMRRTYIAINETIRKDKRNRNGKRGKNI